MNKSISAEPLLAELTAIGAYLVAAQEVLKSGFMPDIRALEGRVTSVCQQVQMASKEAHEKCLPELIKVLEQINDCEQNMRAFHEAQIKAGKTE